MYLPSRARPCPNFNIILYQPIVFKQEMKKKIINKYLSFVTICNNVRTCIDKIIKII